MRRNHLTGLAILFLTLSLWGTLRFLHPQTSSPFSVKSDCSQFLPNGKTPQFENTSYSQKTQTLCFDAYRTLYSQKTRTALWSAEFLTPKHIEEAQKMKRVNVFHAEMQLPQQWRAQNTDYAHSGYDRGHLAPSGDMPTPQAQHQSFSLANMAPQWPSLNRQAWAHLEEAIRRKALKTPLYVITGVLFEGNQIEFLKGRVAIPTTFYKIVFDPTHQQAMVYWALNQANSEVNSEPLFRFEQEKKIHLNLGHVSPLLLHFSNHSHH